MKVSGNITRPVEKVNSTMRTETYMMEIGIIIKLMDSVSIPTSVELATKAIGRMINSMVMALRTGLKVRDTKVNTTCPRRKAKASIHTQMVLHTKDSGLTTKSMALEATSGQTDASITVSGKRTTCMDLESIFTQTT